MLIKKELEFLSQNYNTKLILICEQYVKLPLNIKQEFIKYNQYTLPKDIKNGDIFLAPRDLTNSYNLSHSFTKIGYPMAIGLVVIASPVPSYFKSPAIICNDSKSWLQSIENLIKDSELRKKIGDNGIEYCKENYSKNVILKKYKNIFSNLLSN